LTATANGRKRKVISIIARLFARVWALFGMGSRRRMLLLLIFCFFLNYISTMFMLMILRIHHVSIYFLGKGGRYQLRDGTKAKTCQNLLLHGA
jgi:hypothetical protein